jgi:hypothetical protein
MGEDYAWRPARNRRGVCMTETTSAGTTKTFWFRLSGGALHTEPRHQSELAQTELGQRLRGAKPSHLPPDARNSARQLSHHDLSRNAHDVIPEPAKHFIPARVSAELVDVSASVHLHHQSESRREKVSDEATRERDLPAESRAETAPGKLAPEALFRTSIPLSAATELDSRQGSKPFVAAQRVRDLSPARNAARRFSRPGCGRVSTGKRDPARAAQASTRALPRRNQTGEHPIVTFFVTRGSQIVQLVRRAREFGSGCEGGGECVRERDPTGRLLGAVARSGGAGVWDMGTGNALLPDLLNMKADYWVLDLAFTRDGSRMFTGGDDGAVLVWDLG